MYAVELAASAAAHCAPALWPFSCCEELVLSAAADCAPAGWHFPCCGSSSSASSCTPAPCPFLNQTVRAYLHCAAAACIASTHQDRLVPRAAQHGHQGAHSRLQQHNSSSNMQMNAGGHTAPAFVGRQNLVMHAAVKQHKAAPHWGN